MSKIGDLLVAAALLLALLAASPADTSPQDIQHYTRYAYGGRDDDVAARVHVRGRQGTGKSGDLVGRGYSAAGYSSDRGEAERASNRRRVIGARRGLGSRQRGDQVDSAEQDERHNYGRRRLHLAGRRRRPNSRPRGSLDRFGGRQRTNYWAEEEEEDDDDDYAEVQEQSSSSSSEEETYGGGDRVSPVSQSGQETSEESSEEQDGREEGEEDGSGDTRGESGGNYLVHIGLRREDNGCPEGQVQDIYGYCREVFHEENRDWDWWENIRNYILSGYDSGYQSRY